MRLRKGGRDLGCVGKAIAISKKVLGDRRADEKMDRSRGFHEMAVKICYGKKALSSCT
jgi:hypothetical protein